MSDVRPVALQMCPFSAPLESGLRSRFEVIRWFELGAAEQASWLRQHAAVVRAVVSGGHIGCPDSLLQALPALGIVSINGVGVDKVDLALARSRGVRVTTTPGLLTEDVADLAVGLVIGLLREIPAGDAYVRAGAWRNGDRPLARKVSGRRFGVVGLGHIGLAIAKRLAAFGPVAYTGPARKDVPFDYHAQLLGLARSVDVLLLACPANASTHRMVNAPVLAALGREGYLVNVARGSVVDEAALIEALEQRTIAGAALDVFEAEPEVPARLRESPHVVLTPHVASATVETRLGMAQLVLANLDAYLQGAPLPSQRL
jgi:lactate dehydrogenase-like 2-hydroxyacid dehydrogenase